MIAAGMKPSPAYYAAHRDRWRAEAAAERVEVVMSRTSYDAVLGLLHDMWGRDVAWAADAYRGTVDGILSLVPAVAP